jgi:hypothetical protein
LKFIKHEIVPKPNILEDTYTPRDKYHLYNTISFYIKDHKNKQTKSCNLTRGL